MPTFVKSNPEANKKEQMIPTTTASTGMAVESIPESETEEIMTVAGPVSPASETSRVGL